MIVFYQTVEPIFIDTVFFYLFSRNYGGAFQWLILLRSIQNYLANMGNG